MLHKTILMKIRAATGCLTNPISCNSFALRKSSLRVIPCNITQVYYSNLRCYITTFRVNHANLV